MQNRPFIFKILYLARVPATGLIYSDSIRAKSNDSFSLSRPFKPPPPRRPFHPAPFYIVFDLEAIINASCFLLLIPV